MTINHRDFEKVCLIRIVCLKLKNHILGKALEKFFHDSKINSSEVDQAVKMINDWIDDNEKMMLNYLGQNLIKELRKTFLHS